MPHLKLSLLAALILALSGCARDMSPDTYTAGAVAGKVLEGTIISARKVKIKDHDKLSDNTIGGLGGGAAGAVGGASIGSGNGSLAAGIGGAVIGAIAGAYVQDALSTSEGMEYLVKLDARHARIGNKNKKIVKEHGGSSISEDTKMSIDTDLQTDMISVVQKADPALIEGSRVYVVYHDDRPRLTAMRAAGNN